MATYNFSQRVDTRLLTSEILDAGLLSPQGIATYEDAIEIFYKDDLSGADEATLTTVISNHAVPQDGAGRVVIEPELKTRARIQGSGRAPTTKQNAWISTTHKTYGMYHHTWNHSAGSAEYPKIEWEHSGMIVSEGDIFRNLTLIARSDSSDVTDLEYVLTHRTSDNWLSGIDSDGEMSNHFFHKDMFVNHSSQPTMTGTMRSKRMRIDGIDFRVPSAGIITLHVRPISGLPKPKYMYIDYLFEVEI